MEDIPDWAWCQGAFLPASANGLVDASAEAGDRYVVTPYTCAIARPTAETVVDLLRLRPIHKADGNFTRGKSLRKLHLCVHSDGTSQWFEAVVSGRCSVPASQLKELSPDAETVLSEDDRRALAYWMSARFNKSAFPNDFVDAWKPKAAAIRSLFERALRVELVLVDIGPLGGGRYAPQFTLVAGSAEDAVAIIETQTGPQGLLDQCPMLQNAEVSIGTLDDVSLAQFRSAMHFDAMDDLSIRYPEHSGPLNKKSVTKTTADRGVVGPLDESRMSQRRLIEEWLPIAELGIESLRDRTPMTPFPAPNRLHVWWARRPLVASRAAILASLMPADADHERFMHALGIHGDPVAARKRIAKATREGRRLGADAYGYSRAFGHVPDKRDRAWMTALGVDGATVLDPTAGGGSIPFESIRLGLPTLANDLNPVAALIERATNVFPHRDLENRPEFYPGDGKGHTQP